MEPDLLAWNVSHRLVDGADYHFDKSDEIGERPIAVGGVTFEREVGTVKLQQKAIANDGFVFDLQCHSERVEIALEGVVMFVLNDRRNDAGGGSCEERFRKA